MDQDRDVDTGEYEGDARDTAGLRAHAQRLLHEKKAVQAANKALQERVRVLEQAARIRGHGERAGEPPEEPMSPCEALLHAAVERVAGLDAAAYAQELAKIREEYDALVEPELAAARAAVAAEYEPQVKRLRSGIERLTAEGAARRFIAEHRRAGIAAELLEPTVLPRFAATWTRAGECVASAVDADGAPMSAEALAAELQANPALAPLLSVPAPEEVERRRQLVAAALH